ncbi:MAG: ABC transporter ATP-binding protein [Corynebacterium sp.]|nr:ABC transporter ATP-binding protein [Corynebacterium sp.]
MTSPMNFSHGPARIDPTDTAQLTANPVSVRRIAALFRPHTAAIATVVALIVATSALTVVQPFLVRTIVDEAIPTHNVPQLLTLVAIMVGLVILVQIMGVTQTWMSAGVGQRIMHNLRVRVFTTLQKQSLAFFTTTKSGEIQSRLTNDIAGMRSVVTTTATSIASNLTISIATIVAMVALSPTLSLLSLVIIPPAIWLSRNVALTRRDITAQRQAAMATLQSTIADDLSVSGVRLNKTLGLEPAARDEFATISEKLIGLELKSQLAGRWRMATMQIIFAAIPAAVYIVAGLPATSTGITIGTLIAFTTLQTQVFRPLMGLLNVGVEWVSSMALFSRIFEYLDLTEDLQEPEEPRDTAITGSDIAINNLSYSYPDHTPALADISLTIPAGSITALVGHTGSGKSTLGMLIARLADPTTGSITLGGVDLRDISATTRTRRIGVVSQETYLIHDTVRANLALARPDATAEQMWEVLDLAQVGDLIRSLPDGLDTIVGSRGFRFSGGEQQRLALARTLLADPDIVLLDEATSALDTETEHAVHTALLSYGRSRSLIIIAHRLSTVVDADQIVVLEHGHIAEHGTHSELLADNGIYASLWRVQTADLEMSA